MKKFRQDIWDMYDEKSKAGSYYDVIMMIVIILSLVPLVFKHETAPLLWIDHITVTIFIIDYILRWCTADLNLKRGKLSFVLYPVTPWALLDLICILPSFRIIASGFRVLKIARLIRTLRVFRSFKLIRMSKNIRIIIDVIKDQWRALMTVFALAAGYVLVVALVMFNMEPATFDSFFHAIYWATISLTTIGYGDIFPHSMIGQAFTVISAFVGMAVIALPSGIIAGGFMDEIHKPIEDDADDNGSDKKSVTVSEASSDPIDEIEKLGRLMENGLLTKEEFDSKKAELLSRL